MIGSQFIKKGTTNVSVTVKIIDSTDGTPELGVVFNTAGMDMEYRRELSAVVDITEVTLADLTVAHADGGFLEIGHGLYRLDVPDAAFASGQDGVQILGTVTGMIVVAPYIQLVDLAADAADAVQDEPIEDHVAQGTTGWATALSVYAGPDGPGIYIDSGAANTNTVVGTDGTEKNPVSTFVAARTLADVLGLKIYYLEGNSDITLAATHVDWEFIGIGSVSDNVVNLGSQDVSRSLFRNLTLEGTQGGTGRITARDCALQDPGSGATTLHIFAERCGFVDEIEVDTSNDNVFDQCFSLVAGTATPTIIATGSAGTISVRHYSGGLEFKALSASHNVTWEGIGQVIFNANCNVNANVSVRGIGSIIDNTGGMASLIETSLVNMPKVNVEVVDVLKTDTVTLPGQEAPPLAPTFEEMVAWLYKTLRNRKDATATLWQLFADDETTVDAKATVSDAGGLTTKQEIISGP